MRLRVLAFLALLGAGLIALSLTHGQDAAPARVPPIIQTNFTEPAPPAAALPALSPAPSQPPARDFSKLTPAQKQALLIAQRGATWLYNMNGLTGRFQPGGNHFFHQAAAAAALARAARITGEPRLEARAAQAVLALLDETMIDPQDATQRYTALPSQKKNRLAAAGLLVAAIHELPAPQVDLLEQSDQLCNFIRLQARPDGSLQASDLADESSPSQEAIDAANEYPGLALVGLMLSQRQRPAAWKTDLVRKALTYYKPRWQAHKNPACIPAQTAAYSEAFVLTKEPAFAAFVLEMNDWLCELQYEKPRMAWWEGGFKSWQKGQAVEDAPTIASARYGESLACACRIADLTAEVQRYDRYGAAATRSMKFVESLQFTLGNTSQFDAAYREMLSGGFHASQQDANLRIDYTAQAVAAMLQYVEQVR